MFVAHSVGLSGIVACSILRSTTNFGFTWTDILSSCLTQVTCLIPILVACVH